MADKRSIYQFASGQGQQNSLLLMDNPDVSATSGYTTEKLSIGELGAVIGAILYTQILDTNVKNIFGGINELFARCMNIADDYDDTETYDTGDYVFYQNAFYKCNDDSVTGTWDSSKWDITTVADELANGGGGSGGSWTDVTGTLTAGNTSVTLSDASISSSSTIDIYTDVFGVNPTNVVVSAGSVVLTFEAQQSNIGVKVRVS